MKPGAQDAAQDDAALALCLLAVGGSALGGVSIKGAASGEALALLQGLMPDRRHRRLPLHISESRLLGGIDLASTLQAGRPVLEPGLLAEANGGAVVVPMAERITPKIAAHLAAALDLKAVTVERDGFTARNAADFIVVALDESVEGEAGPPPALLERLTFHLDLRGRSPREGLRVPFSQDEIARARKIVGEVDADDAVIASLCHAAISLGIESVRAPLMAMTAARSHAALMGRRRVSEADAKIAARLVLAPRATMLPADADEDAEPPPPEPTEDHEEPSSRQESRNEPLEDVVLDAAKAAIPPGLLAMLQTELMVRARSPSSGRADAARMIALRGRPVGTRRGELKSGARLNVIETLRVAAPWQTLRRRGQSDARRVAVRKDDFRLTRFKPRSETATVFVVDASGSAAMHRLAEAKGAVELLLADCYVRRDQVALIAFRGKTAELILPPTRSLTRAKRSLSALPGGGGTPLAAAVDAANALGDGIRRKGIAPTLVFLTDGRANIARDGSPGRDKAQADAIAAAKLCRAGRLGAVVLDISPHPADAAQKLATELGARYFPLPHADAALISRAVRSAMPTENAARS